MATEFAPGATLAGRYRVVRTLGAGGFGSVYACQALQGGYEAAVKVLHTRHAEDRLEERRFEREAQLIAQLRHPNIVRILEHGRLDDGTPFIAFEMLHGESLHEVLTRRGALGEAEAARVTQQVLAALSVAHRAGIIHRDIKPPNIFLTDGSTEQVKVLDFGVAKVFRSQQDNATKLTASGMLLGTPRYMAPEQVRGNSALTPACDVYAVGLVLSEMLSGERAISGPSDIDILFEHLKDDEHVLHPAVSATRLASVVARAIHKQPGERYSHAEQMLSALEVALGLRAAPAQPSPSSTVAIPAAPTASIHAQAPGTLAMPHSVASPPPASTHSRAPASMAPLNVARQAGPPSASPPSAAYLPPSVSNPHTLPASTHGPAPVPHSQYAPMVPTAPHGYAPAPAAASAQASQPSRTSMGRGLVARVGAGVLLLVVIAAAIALTAWRADHLAENDQPKPTAAPSAPEDLGGAPSASAAQAPKPITNCPGQVCDPSIRLDADLVPRPLKHLPAVLAVVDKHEPQAELTHITISDVQDGKLLPNTPYLGYMLRAPRKGGGFKTVRATVWRSYLALRLNGSATSNKPIAMPQCELPKALEAAYISGLPRDGEVSVNYRELRGATFWDISRDDRTVYLNQQCQLFDPFKLPPP